MADLAVIILTHNEELHLERALKHVAPFAREVFVIDSQSTDSTVAIAEAHGAVVFQNKFINYAKQFQWALDNAPISSGWVMRLDADEIVEPDLAREIGEKLGGLPPDVVGVNLKRKHIFLGRWLRFGGRYPLLLLRIWRRGRGRIEDRWMDEHIVLDGGRVVTFEGGFADHNLKDLTFFTDKHNRYATREAIDVICQQMGLNGVEFVDPSTMSSRQASVKRFIKERFFNVIPFGVSTTGYFLYRYFLQLGFLDGRPGLIYHFLQGYWYRFLVGAKLFELSRAIGHLHDKAAIKGELQRLTGHRLD